MNNNRWREVERIFDETLELPETDRAAFIAQACNGDQTLQHEVESLLAAHQQANGFLVASATRLSPLQELSTTVVAAQRIGPYQLLREIAQGGMGTVWLAERADDQFKQQVAIKLLKAGAHNSSIAGRLRHERQILADLNHPNIARLLDGGTTESGQPYLVMEYIEGSPIDEYCQQRQLGLRERLQLFRQVCAAVQYAHQHLIIHRDLKPANILVTADGTPKLLDFGIAKLLQPDLSQSYQTQAGQTPMTPAYASPEQVRSETLTTTSDVYSLGVVLYELLTGRSPYQLKENTFGALSRAICEQEPTRPSAATTQNESASSIRTPHSALRNLKGDLDSIVLMALRKEPTARYSSVEQFSADIQRYLDGLPTLARKGTFAYRAVKYVRRYKVPVAAAALILLSLLVGIGATARQAQIARAAQVKAEAERIRAEQALVVADEQRSRAEEEARRADLNAQQLKTSLAETEQQKQEAINQQLIAEEQRQLAEEQRTLAESQKAINYQQLYTAQMNLAGQAWEQANIGRMNELLDLHLPQSGRTDVRGFEWYLLHRLGHSELPIVQHEDMVRQVYFMPDSRKMLSAATDGVKLTDIATGRELNVFKGHSSAIQATAISQDGKILATGGADHTIKLWNVATGKELRTLQEQYPVNILAVSPDGKTLATEASVFLRRPWNIKLWDVATGREMVTLKGHSKWINQIVFSPDGQQVATSGQDNQIKLWEVATGRELFTFGKENTSTLRVSVPVAFSPDGRRLVTGDSFNPNLAYIWDSKTGKEVITINDPVRMFAVAFSPDSQKLATANIEGNLKMWDVATGKELYTSKGHKPGGALVTFSPDGLKMASVGTDKTIKLWEVKSGQEIATLKGHSNFIFTAVFSPDGRWLASGSMDKTTRLWDIDKGLKPFPISGENMSVAFAPDNKSLALGGVDGTFKLLDVETGKELVAVKGHAREIDDMTFSPDGKTLATSSNDRLVKLWTVPGGKERVTLRGHQNILEEVVFTPDGKQVVTVSHDNTIRVWDVASGKEQININKGHAGFVMALDISPDGKWMVTSSLDKTAKLWDFQTKKEVRTFTMDGYGIQAVAFSPDGRWVATGADNSIIKLWEVATGREVMALKGHSSQVFSIAFSPDGRRLASGSADATARLWDLTSGQEILTLNDPQGSVHVAFSPDGKRLATVNPVTRITKIWHIATSAEVAAQQSKYNRQR